MKAEETGSFGSKREVYCYDEPNRKKKYFWEIPLSPAMF